jgi:hypothetical protein
VEGTSALRAGHVHAPLPTSTRHSALLAATTLKAAEDKYDGMIIDASALPSDPEQFGRELLASLEVSRNAHVVA